MPNEGDGNSSHALVSGRIANDQVDETAVEQSDCHSEEWS